MSFFRRVPRPYLGLADPDSSPALAQGSDPLLVQARAAASARAAERGHAGIVARAAARQADRERAAMGKTVRRFQVGDKVLIKDPARARRGVLAMPYMGPYVVKEVIGGGGCVKVEDLAGSPLPRPVDVARLKLAPPGAIPSDDKVGAGFFEVDRILEHKEDSQGGLLFKVLWKGGTLSWEPRESFVGTRAVEAYLTAARGRPVPPPAPEDPSMPGAAEVVRRVG